MAVQGNDDTNNKDRAEGSVPNTIIIDEKVVLAATGDTRLESVRQLIVRGMRLKSFDSACASRLRNLTVLSLSNNKLRDLGSFVHLVSLVELNINFNAVTSLEGLACPRLQKLYLSNNLLASTARLRGFPKLQTLCLFKNVFPDLASTLEPLRGLADLRELDLDGNPCARSCGYKHRVIRSCPRLHELDGEEISQLDRDLSTLFYEENRTDALWATTDGTTFGSDSRRRPATAPVAARRRDGSMRRPGTAAKGALGLPFGEARLLGSDRLNNDPQLLSYLAEGVLAHPCDSPRDAIGRLRREEGRACSINSEDYEKERPPHDDGDDDDDDDDADEDDADDADASASQDVLQEEPAMLLLLSTTPRTTEQRLSPMTADDCREETTSKRGSTDGGRRRASSGLAARLQQQVDSSPRSTDGQGEHGCLGRGRREGGDHNQGVASSVDDGSSKNNAIDRGEDSAVDGGGRALLRELELPKEHQQQEEEGEEEIESSRQGQTTDADDSSCGFASAPTESVANNDAELAPNGSVGGKRATTSHSTCSSSRGAYDAGRGIPPNVASQTTVQDSRAGGGCSTTTVRKSGRSSRRKEGSSPRPLPPPPPLPPSRSEMTTLDPSNPFTTIRKLLKLVETLQLELADRDEAVGRTGEHCHNANGCDNEDYSSSVTPSMTREDVERLRLENRNMHLLLVENRELKRQAREEGARAEKVRRGLDEELARVKLDLKIANQKIEAEAVARRGKAAHSSSGPVDDSAVIVFPLACPTGLSPLSAVDGLNPSHRKGTAFTPSLSGRPLPEPLSVSTTQQMARRMASGELSTTTTTATTMTTTTTPAPKNVGSIVDEEPETSASSSSSSSSSSSVDGELEELFRRNQQSMGEIRRDLELARRESEPQFRVSSGGGGERGGGGRGGVGSISERDYYCGGVDDGRRVVAGRCRETTPNIADYEAGEGEDCRQERTCRDQPATAGGSSPPTASTMTGHKSGKGRHKNKGSFKPNRAPFYEGGGDQEDIPASTSRRYRGRSSGGDHFTAEERRLVGGTVSSEPPSVSELLVSLERGSRTLHATDSAQCCTAGKAPLSGTASDDGGFEDSGVSCGKPGWLREGSAGKSHGGGLGREMALEKRLERRASRDEGGGSATGASHGFHIGGSGCNENACDGDLVSANRGCPTKFSKEEAVSVSSGVRGRPRSRGGVEGVDGHTVLPATGWGSEGSEVRVFRGRGTDEEGGRVTMFSSNARALLTS